MTKSENKIDRLQQKEFLESIKDILDSHSKQRKKDDAQKINRLKKVFSKTEMGREALQFIKDNKIKILMDHKTDLPGYYLPSSMSVCINANKDFHFQISVLMHELRHAWQDKNGLFLSLNNMDIEPYIYFRRLLEADCYTHQALHALQLSKSGMIKPLIAQVDSNFAVTKEITQNNKGNDNTEILLNGFNAWISDDEEIQFYDDYYMDLFISGLEQQLIRGTKYPAETENNKKPNVKTSQHEYLTNKGYDKKLRTYSNSNLQESIFKLGQSFAKVHYTKGNEQEIIDNPRCFSTFLDTSKEKLDYINKLKKALSSKNKASNI